MLKDGFIPTGLMQDFLYRQLTPLSLGGKNRWS